MKRYEQKIKKDLKEAFPKFEKDFNYVLKESSFRASPNPNKQNKQTVSYFVMKRVILCGVLFALTLVVILSIHIMDAKLPISTDPNSFPSSGVSDSKITEPSISEPSSETHQTVGLETTKPVGIKEARDLFDNRLLETNSDDFLYYCIAYNYKNEAEKFIYQYKSGSITVSPANDIDALVKQLDTFKSDGRNFYVSKINPLEIYYVNNEYIFTANFTDCESKDVVFKLNEIIF